MNAVENETNITYICMIQGRGPLFSCSNLMKMGQVFEYNGIEYQVIGIERFAVPSWSPLYSDPRFIAYLGKKIDVLDNQEA